MCALKKNYYELRRIKPRLRRLKECLEEAPYSGEKSETDSTLHRVNCTPGFLGVSLLQLQYCYVIGHFKQGCGVGVENLPESEFWPRI